MKCFQMYRREDISDTHDENQMNAPSDVQFEGVIFQDGKCAIRWLTAKRSITVWDSFEDMMAIHGHPEYGSELVWLVDTEAFDSESEEFPSYPCDAGALEDER